MVKYPKLPTHSWVKPIRSGGGTNVPLGVVFPGPSTNKSVIALTSGNVVVAASGFPGPDP